MGERTQIGAKVDKELWAEFREDVQERKGQTRGVLGVEVERALRAYMYGEGEPKVNEKLDRIESLLETQLGQRADGSGTPSDAETHTRAEPGEKPPANATTDRKVAYLAATLLVRENCDDISELQTLPESHITEVVKEEYAFRSDTAERYVNGVIDYLGLRRHPTAANILASPWHHEELVEERRADVEAEANDKLGMNADD